VNLGGAIPRSGEGGRLQDALDAGRTEEAVLRLLLGVARALHAFAAVAPEAHDELLSLLVADEDAPDLDAPADR
jgi:hypothetical protein